MSRDNIASNFPSHSLELCGEATGPCKWDLGHLSSSSDLDHAFLDISSISPVLESGWLAVDLSHTLPEEMLTSGLNKMHDGMQWV